MDRYRGRDGRSPDRGRYARDPPSGDQYIPSSSSRQYRRDRSPAHYRRRSPSPPPRGAGESYRGRPRSPPRGRGGYDARDTYPARPSRRISPRGDHRYSDSRYDDGPRAPRARSPLVGKRDRDYSPSSRAMRSPPPAKRERLESPPRDYARPRSPPRRRYSPRREREGYKARSRSPPRRDDPYTANSWRGRSQSPQRPARVGSGRNSGDVSRPSSPRPYGRRPAEFGDSYATERNPRSPYANNGYEKEAEPPYRPAAKEPVAPASEYRERAPPTGPANNGRYAGPPSETASPSSSTMPMSAHNRPGSASMNPPSHPRGSGGFRGRGGPSPYSRDQAPARDYPGPPFRRGSSFDGPRGGLSSRGAHGPPRGGDPYPPRDPYSPIDSNRFDGPSRGPPPSRPPPRRGGDSYGAGSGPPSFRGSSNSTSMTYPRTQRFNQATPASRALADLPTPKDGGEKLPPLWESSKAEKLEEDAAKLRKMIDDREMKKRETIREWDKLERETSTASLRSDLAEQQLRALNGDHEGMSEAF